MVVIIRASRGLARNCEKLLHLASEQRERTTDGRGHKTFVPQHSFAFNSLSSLLPPSLPPLRPQSHTEQPPTDHSLDAATRLSRLPPGHFLFQRHGRPSSGLPVSLVPEVS